eukprot:scaffold2728_cov137-Skeletonema_marinoi.AAC.11
MNIYGERDHHATLRLYWQLARQYTRTLHCNQALRAFNSNFAMALRLSVASALVQAPQENI